ncbi:holin [Chryseobacterium lactis]|uniref:Holin n=1 Tax=Chryseobacterium lactis TaxID=1241981 RepID=A0A3G6RHQ1_CHRLC|nr:phage holin family protein [Chryseobacterium lactis]AZA82156.1 holin [Chryseobacterium lactis]AZB02537.1 holin [Chryseobacterium lactis]PNW14167.1 holin [Chryseobacterium lactis]
MIEIIGFDDQAYKIIIAKLFMVCGAWICVLIAILIDLYFGIQKSKSIGEHTSSEGFRRSIQKFAFYYSMMFFALIFDTLFLPVSISLNIAYILKVAPLFSILCAAGLVLTEAKSVREKADQKLRRKTDRSNREIASGLFDLLKNKDSIIDLINTVKKDESNNTSTD